MFVVVVGNCILFCTTILVDPVVLPTNNVAAKDSAPGGLVPT